MRIRSIKPEFWRSDDIAVLDIEDRLLFVGLWSYVDDSGIGVDKVAHICADLFAPDLERDPPEVFARVTGGLQKLAERGLIQRYEVEGKRYLYITNWTKHQRIDKPSKKRYPSPDEALCPSSRGLQEGSGSVPEKVAPGAGEQGSRGTGEQGSSLLVQPERQDVENICALLADRIESNGAKRPAITKQWKDAARLLIDKDGYTPDQVAWIINWSQDDEFWRTNILSMPKLRKQFEQLKLKSRAGTTAGKPAPSQRMAETASLGQRLQAQYDQKELL